MRGQIKINQSSSLVNVTNSLTQILKSNSEKAILFSEEEEEEEEMAEKQRWIAMYTKHLKQKRKVYHDGFLDLHIARKKVFLHSSLPILRI